VLVDEDDLVAADSDRQGAGDGTAEVSHRRGVRIGLRHVELHHWALKVNGERLFTKGINLGPGRPDPAGPGAAATVVADVHRAREAGLDLLRVQGHVAPPELYDAADGTGMLLWQDLPLEGGYARGTRGQAVRQARLAVQVLGHHPSVALWCGHHDPDDVDAPLPFPLPEDNSPTGWFGRLAAAQLPSWNRSILDRSIRRALSKADKTRPVVTHSWVLPHLPQIDGTDTELSLGWRDGNERDLPALAAALPRLVRFVGAFGSQSLPAGADRNLGKGWPDLDWDQLAALGADRTAFERHLPPATFGSFEEWLEAGQRYQASLLRHHIEHLRRLKYRPTTGFTYGLLADAVPAASVALLDHTRTAKLGWPVLAEACRPVVVTADRLPPVVSPGDILRFDVHVVSDLHRVLPEARVSARLCWPGGDRWWRWGGEIPADRCVRVGRVDFEVPDIAGSLTLDLRLEGPCEAMNKDETTVTIR
jgi:beta-mannosidase